MQAHAVVPLITVVLAGGVLVGAVWRFTLPAVTSCPAPVPDWWLTTGAFTTVVGAFLFGGLLGKLPHQNPHSKRPGRSTQLGLTIVSGLLALAWGYETLAVANPPMPPITSFVICLKHAENDWTLLVFVLAALLAGRLIWHQPGRYFQ
jgi:hypothetical protein